MANQAKFKVRFLLWSGSIIVNQENHFIKMEMYFAIIKKLNKYMVPPSLIYLHHSQLEALFQERTHRPHQDP